MSTRSGKRIHGSLHEDVVKIGVELAPKSERKTRSKLITENIEEPNIVLQKFKKRENYVSYPTDDEQVGDTAIPNDNEGKHTRILRKNVLKELNPPPTESFDTVVPPISVRSTRRMRKLTELAENDIKDAAVVEKKSKKSKRKKISLEDAETQQKTTKKNKKKKAKKSNSFVIESVTEEGSAENNVNISHLSNDDSFHSAAGSPVADVEAGIETEVIPNKINQPKKTNKNVEKTQTKHKSDELISEQDLSNYQNGTFDIDKQGKKLSIDTGMDVTDNTTCKNISVSRDEDVSIKNDTFDIEQKTGNKKRLSIKNAALDDTVTKIRQYDANMSLSEDGQRNDTFEIDQKTGNKRRSSIRSAAFNETVTKIRQSDANNSHAKEEQKKNDTFDIEQKTGNKKRSSINDALNGTVTKIRQCHAHNMSLSEDGQRNDTFDIEQKTGNKRSSIKNATFNETVTKIRQFDEDISLSKEEQKKDDTFDFEQNTGNKKRSRVKSTGFGDSVTNIRKSDANIYFKNDQKNNTFDVEERMSDVQCEAKTINTTFDKESTGSETKSRKRKSTADSLDLNTITSVKQTDKKPSLNSTYEKEDAPKVNLTFEVDKSPNKTKKKSTMDTTFEKESESPKSKLRKSSIFVHSERKSNEINKRLTGFLNKSNEPLTIITQKLNTVDEPERVDTTFDKDNLNTTFDKLSKSLISSDSNNEDISRISITSDESMAEAKAEPAKPVTIMNDTPVLIDSSADSLISEDAEITPLKREGTFSLETEPVPLKREGTFTKDGPDNASNDNQSPVTPWKNASLSSPGRTPFPNKSSTKKMLNVTRSIEKRSTLDPAPRMTRVMFCSPVNTPMVVAQQKRTVIKSNLKGSNKSFVYEEIASSPVVGVLGSRRKRSHTHCGGAEEALVKRSRLTDDAPHCAGRPSRTRTSSANAKLTDLTPSKKSTTPSKAKVGRTKLPNFAAMHQKQFEKMESLDECQERKAKRARQLLTPTPGLNLPDKSSPKVTDSPKQPKKEIKKVDTLIKSFSQEASKPAYTRFGFKLNLDVNPFSIPSKNPVKKENPSGLKRQATLPSLTGATSVRREVAKQMVMREKSFSDKRSLKRNENRTIIKGVRTNRRFELQMKLRNIE